MAGRGGGKRGWVPPTGAQLFLKKTAQECGLDDRNLRSLQDITRPALFPALGWLSNGEGTYDVGGPLPEGIQPAKRTSQALYLMRKQRELWHRQKALPYHIQPTQQVDVERYSKRKKMKADPGQELQTCMGRNACSSLFVPPELIQSEKKKAAAGTAAVPDGVSSSGVASKKLDELARKERRPDAQGDEEGEEQAFDDADEDGGEEEEAEDYTTNYYASEEESEDGGGGDDGEPTF